jgi:hypothetical protein
MSTIDQAQEYIDCGAFLRRHGELREQSKRIDGRVFIFFCHG